MPDMLMLTRVNYVIDSCLKPLLSMYEEIVFCWWLPILGQGMRRYSILFTNNNYYWWETWFRNKDSFMHWFHVQGATTTRDANLWRAKIWRLSFFHYPPEFKLTPPPPPPRTPSPQWEWLRAICEALHEVHTMVIRNHRFDARNNIG